MEITKPLLQLWIGASVFAGFASYIIGATHALRITAQYLTHGEMEGSKAFAVGAPMLIAIILALVGAISAMVGLFCSWRFDGRSLFSTPHLVTLIFCAPLLLAFFLPPFERYDREATIDQGYYTDHARD